LGSADSRTLHAKIHLNRGMLALWLPSYTHDYNMLSDSDGAVYFRLHVVISRNVRMVLSKPHMKGGEALEVFGALRMILHSNKVQRRRED
jgi:hypothetical protein